MKQGSASALPILSVAGEVIPVEASRREGSAAPVSGEELSRDLTRASGGPKAWGRPQIEWANPRNPRATVTTEGSE
jgi:hypothetical protein